MSAEQFMTTSTSATKSERDKCPKCGITKRSGKPSCCARSGAWFQKCGDAGDTKFNHTWIEGVHACDSVVISILTESPARVRDSLFIQQSINTSEPQNAAREQTNIQLAADVSDTDSMNGEDHVTTLIAVFTTSVLFVICS